MREDKSKKRRFYLIILIFITGMMLATTTYAWFTANRIVFVDTLNLKIEANGGIEISADGIDWKSTLQSVDILNAIDTYQTSVNQLPIKLEPVSTGGNVDTTNGFLEMFYGITNNNVDGDYVLTATRSTEVSSNEVSNDGLFVAFDIFLKITKDTDLYLTTQSGATYTGDRLPGIENAIRFAFLDEGNTAATSAINTIQSMNNATNDTTYIWEPNYDTHALSALEHAFKVYGLNLRNTGCPIVTYDGITSAITEVQNVLIQNANSTQFPTAFKTVDVDYATPKTMTANQQVFNLKTGITKVRVYIWLEGQDVDCENASAVGNVDVQFQFTTNPA